MRLVDKLKIITPFSYMWILRRAIGNPKTILDLGCGDGNLMTVVAQGKDWEITGVDIFPESLKKAKKKGIYRNLIYGDILKTVRNLNKRRSKYDVVFFSQVIEHISRGKGEKVLSEIEKLAKERIIIGTPRGFMVQPEEFLGDNPFQNHRSGWSQEDFLNRGYKVYGVGFSPVWSESGLARTRSIPIFVLGTLLAYLFSPIVYFFPSLGSGLLCVKEIR